MLHLIFDWSGTLADEKLLSFTGTRDTIVKLGGKSISRKLFDNTIRLPIDGFYRDHLPQTPMSLINKTFHNLYNQGLAQITLYPGIKELLISLSQHAHLSIVSSIDTKPILKVLRREKVDHLFKYVSGGAKDKRKVLGHFLKRHHISALDAYYVGDLPHDIEAAKTNGLPSVAVAYGYSSSKKLKEYHPDYLEKTVGNLSQSLAHIAFWYHQKAPIMTVGGLIQNPDKKFLFVRTAKWSGKWGIPGGKVEYGETLEHAFKREILEETGLSVTKCQLVMVQDSIESTEFYRPRHFVLANYIAQCKHLPVTLNYESQDMHWWTLQEAKNINLNTPTKKLIEHILNLSPNIPINL